MRIWKVRPHVGKKKSVGADQGGPELWARRLAPGGVTSGKVGVHAPLVAEWARHTVEMLLSTYAKCIHGQEAAARDRIAQALGGANLPAA